MMICIRNEKGIALVTSLLLSLLALVIVMAVLYLVTQSTQGSGASKRYSNAMQASYGGVDVFTRNIIPEIVGGTVTSTLESNLHDVLNAQFDSSHPDCLSQKLLKSTADWDTTSVCGADAKENDPKQHPDATFTLAGLPLQPGYKIFTQVVDTVQGNSDTSSYSDYLDSGSGVTGSSSSISPMHMPALYTIEVQGEKQTNATEKARLSVLYMY
jgi:hypothetical protein